MASLICSCISSIKPLSFSTLAVNLSHSPKVARSTGRAISPSREVDMREPYHYQGDQVETIHVYMLREQDHLVVDAQPEPDYPTNQHTLLGYLCCGLLVLLCVLAPLTAILYAGSLPHYDTTISRTLTLTLSLHPTTNQIPLYQLPPITRTQQATAKATGTFHQGATPATGLITFYNGSLTARTASSWTPPTPT